MKVNLAKNICAQFYDAETAEQAAEEFDRVFSNKEIPDEVPEYRVPDGEKSGGKIWIVKLMVLAGTAATNGEARRLIKGGGVTFERRKDSRRRLRAAPSGRGHPQGRQAEIRQNNRLIACSGHYSRLIIKKIY